MSGYALNDDNALANDGAYNRSRLTCQDMPQVAQ